MNRMLLLLGAAVLCGCDKQKPVEVAAEPEVPRWRQFAISPDGSENRFVLFESQYDHDGLGKEARALFRLDTWTGRVWRQRGDVMPGRPPIQFWTEVCETEDPLVNLHWQYLENFNKAAKEEAAKRR